MAKRTLLAAAAASVLILCVSQTQADDVSVLGPAVANYVTGTMDGWFTWYEQGFNPNAPTTGLPPAGVVQSETNPTWSFRLQQYDQNNVLLMNAAAPAGTMTLSQPSNLTNLAIAVSTGVGPATMAVTIHFGDGTPDYSPAALTEPDWVISQSQMLVVTHGRVLTQSVDDLNLGPLPAGDLQYIPLGGPYIDIQTITLPASLSHHPITSFTFDLTSTTHGNPYYTNTAIFAISGSTDNAGTFAPLDLTASSFNKDVVVEAAALPEPAAGMIVIAAMVALARRRGSIVRV
jgi:hypothetical protein